MFSIGIHDVLSKGRGIPAIGAIRQVQVGPLLVAPLWWWRAVRVNFLAGGWSKSRPFGLACNNTRLQNTPAPKRTTTPHERPCND